MKWLYLVLSYVVPYCMIEFVLFIYLLNSVVGVESKYFMLCDVCAVLVMTALSGVNCWVAYKYLYPLRESKKVIINVFMQLNAMFIIIITIGGMILALTYGDYFTRVIRILSYLWSVVCNIF